MANRYVVVGQAWIAEGTGGAPNINRLVPGDNTVNVSDGTYTITCVTGTTASAASGTATITGSPVACAEAAGTVITVTGTGTITVTVTYNSAGQSNSTYSYSASSGGISNASVPTSTDNLYPDALSFTGVSQAFNLAAALSCLDFNWTGATNTPTLSGSGRLRIYGNLTLISGMIWSRAAVDDWDWNATSGSKNMVTAGITVTGVLHVEGAGAWTLQDNLNTGGGIINPRLGTLNTNNKTITCAGFNKTTTNVITITLGASTINCTNWDMATGGGSVVLNANTSTINISATGAFAGNGLTYNTVSLNGTAHTITGNNIIANLTLAPSGAQTITATGTTQTVTGMSRTGTGLITIAGGTWTKTGGGILVLSHLSISNSTATPGASFYVVGGSNGGGNNGWVFYPPTTQVKLVGVGVI